jgi:hypothetical protein
MTATRRTYDPLFKEKAIKGYHRARKGQSHKQGIRNWAARP